MDLDEVINTFESLKNEENIKGQAHFGINPKMSYGLRIPQIRKIAKKIGTDHDLALKLWNHGYHESRLLATMIEDPDEVTKEQLNNWTCDFDTWDIVDQACLNLYDKIPQAKANIFIWANSKGEFVKRTAFSLIAVIAVHDKSLDDEYFNQFYPLIIEASCDNRNFVKKSVNWALRQIGKRNKNLNTMAIKVSEQILDKECKAAKWISKNALKELQSDKVQERLKNKS